MEGRNPSHSMLLVSYMSMMLDSLYLLSRVIQRELHYASIPPSMLSLRITRVHAALGRGLCLLCGTPVLVIGMIVRLLDIYRDGPVMEVHGM